MLNLYMETSFHVRPPTPTSVVSFQVPPHDESYHSFKHPSPASANEKRTAFKDDTSFAKKYLASQGSIYFRQSKTYPRSFLWRVVDDDRVLEIQCTDLRRSESERNEAHLTLRLEFHDQIAPAGIALADRQEEEGILFVFVITSRKELYTLSLPTVVFKSGYALEGQFKRWSKTFIPSSFLIDQPHHLYAASPTELYLSFDSGRFQRLTRNESNGGAEWVPDNFDDRSWGASIRGFVSRQAQNAIGFGSRLLNSSTAHAIVTDSRCVYTVCLNHTLRVWSLKTGRIVASQDLLGKPRAAQENVSLDPHAVAFVRYFTPRPANHPVLLTWTPHDGGQFKFWAIKGDSDATFVIEDKFPHHRLSPPDPDPSGSTIWSLIGFEVRPGDTQKASELWVLWRNNNYHRLQSVYFDFVSLPESWEQNWSSTTFAAPAKTNAPDLIKSVSDDTTENWLTFLFWPDRYPSAVLETALSIYQDAMQARPALSSQCRSLQERLCSSVAANVTLRKYGDSKMDYERFVADSDGQWRNYWRMVETINASRQAPLSLAFDTYVDTPWIIMTDQCCVVRECSQVELLRYNDGSNVGALELMASERWTHRKIGYTSRETLQRMFAVVKTASEFGSKFSPELTREIQVAIDEELLQDPESPIPLRVSEFYERCNFADAISNETYDQLVKDLEQIGGFEGLTNNLIFAVLNTLPEHQRGPASLLRYTIFGSTVLTAGLQDTIQLGRQLVVDLFVLIVFLECEVNQEEKTFSEFDAAELFIHLTRLMKSYEKKFWLNSHVRLVPLEFPGAELSSNALRKNDGLSMEHGRMVTALCDTLGKAIRPQPTAGLSESFLLTQGLEEIESWVGGVDEISYDDGLVYIQCDFLVQGNLELATEFMRFLPRTPWSTYVKGRLHLARSKYDAAALCFRKAAYPLAYGKAAGSLIELSAGLLSMMDTECFFNGLPSYYQHLSVLFESEKAFDYAADFARLALQSLSSAFSTQHEQGTAVKALTSNILSHIFRTEIMCSRFTEAYMALAQLTDAALQRSSLISLMRAIFEPLSPSTTAEGLVLLQSLPIGMHPHLSRHLDEHLSALAKQQSAIRPSNVLPEPSLLASGSGVDYLKILHALRTTQKDYRGSIAVLHDRLKLVRNSRRLKSDPRATELRYSLLTLINALCCVATDEAYILDEVEVEKTLLGATNNGTNGTASVTDWKKSERKRRRVVVTLADLRREYSQVLDKCSRIERGDFEFYGNGEKSDEEDEPASDGEAMEWR